VTHAASLQQKMAADLRLFEGSGLLSISGLLSWSLWSDYILKMIYLESMREPKKLFDELSFQL
jgi:hypothetical protein